MPSPSRSRFVFMAAIVIGIVFVAGPRAAQRDVCTDQRNAASRAAEAEYRKAQIDAQTERDDKLRVCGDSACKRDATLAYTERMRDVIRDRDHRLADIRKQEVDCRLAPNAAASASQTTSNDPDATPDGLYKLQT